MGRFILLNLMCPSLYHPTSVANIIFYRTFITAYHIYVIASTPEVSIPIFVPNMGIFSNINEATFTLQIPHKAQHTHMRMYGYQHVIENQKEYPYARVFFIKI